jgi:general nucleoside transport system permease protein
MEMMEWTLQLITEVISNFGAASFWVAVLRIATPLIFGTLGILLCERAGVLNLGIEGIMAAGAFVGWYVCYLGFGLWGGVGAAALVGALLGCLHSLLTVRLALSQHVAGLGITLFASSLTYYSYRVLFPKVTSPPTIAPFEELHGFLDAVPLIGSILGGVTALTFLALLCTPIVHYLLYKTPLGLAIRTVGENPHAATSAGIDVYRVRTIAIVAGSALMAVGGAFLTMAAFNAFFFNMVNGRGWICVALVVFASWRPSKALFGALLFAAFDALQLRLQQSPGNVLPYQLYLMVPYLLSILALVLVARKAAYPAALMKPYLKGER